MVVSELKMKIEMLESKLQMREEQIDSLKAELNRLNTFLMLERRSVFARLRDYLVVLILNRIKPTNQGPFQATKERLYHWLTFNEDGHLGRYWQGMTKL